MSITSPVKGVLSGIAYVYYLFYSSLMSNFEVLPEPQSESQEITTVSYDPMATLPGALVVFTEQAALLGIVEKATPGVNLLLESHRETLADEDEQDRMHIAIVDASTVAQNELLKDSGADPSAVIKALHKHLTLKEKTRLVARKFRNR